MRLDVKAAAFKGGEVFGASEIPGWPEESPLIRLVRGDEPDLRMPPEGEPLSADELGTLTRWVAEGAVWPDGVDLAVLDDPRSHWSFQPVVHQLPPQPHHAAWVRNDIDGFILARLEAEGLQPATPVDRAAWLRWCRWT